MSYELDALLHDIAGFAGRYPDSFDPTCMLARSADALTTAKAEIERLKAEREATLASVWREAGEHVRENERLESEVIDTVEMLATAIARADAAEVARLVCQEALRGLFGMIEDGSFVKAERFAGWRLGLLQKISAALVHQPAEPPAEGTTK